MEYSDVRAILAEGMVMKEEVKQTNLDRSIRQARAIAREWYRKQEYHPVSVNIISMKKI
jgi:hypothetical protein